jgi:hypothetical protein
LHYFVEQGVEEVQGSVGKLVGKVVHGGDGQRASGHGELMPCHGMAWFASVHDAIMYQSLSEVLGRLEGGQWSTFDELSMRV